MLCSFGGKSFFTNTGIRDSSELSGVGVNGGDAISGPLHNMNRVV